ncbi:hypothetical protein K461DRAFT_162643 [Myriangium duriaei CBS 260.36]|uniref:Uncharacterized protein n=1 Tax=Myriangium duriaei CBS 260.36 TaxID=1168546 RepID=A0A9P4MGG0_9PEZI|nr:hypothetical protein K461DRAFT_162643 [Myriangium duriaei CBS 260.36]
MGQGGLSASACKQPCKCKKQASSCAVYARRIKVIGWPETRSWNSWVLRFAARRLQLPRYSPFSVVRGTSGPEMTLRVRATSPSASNLPLPLLVLYGLSTFHASAQGDLEYLAALEGTIIIISVPCDHLWSASSTDSSIGDSSGQADRECFSLSANDFWSNASNLIETLAKMRSSGRFALHRIVGSNKTRISA